MKIRSPQKRTCAMCGRVGTRVFTHDSRGRDICLNKPACVNRLCDKAFLDPPPELPDPDAGWTFLGTLMEDVKFYGVLDDSEAPTMRATLWMPEPKIPIEGGSLHALDGAS